MIRYLTWRNTFGVLSLAILVMIWPLEIIGWYTLNISWSPEGSPSIAKINVLTGHAYYLEPEHLQANEEFLEEYRDRRPEDQDNTFIDLSKENSERKRIPAFWKKWGW